MFFIYRSKLVIGCWYKFFFSKILFLLTIFWYFKVKFQVYFFTQNVVLGRRVLTLLWWVTVLLFFIFLKPRGGALTVPPLNTPLPCSEILNCLTFPFLFLVFQIHYSFLSMDSIYYVYCSLVFKLPKLKFLETSIFRCFFVLLFFPKIKKLNISLIY